MVKAKTSQNGPTRMISYENKTGFFFIFFFKTHYLPRYYFMEPDLNSGIIFMTGLVWLASYVKQLSVPGFFFIYLFPLAMMLVYCQLSDMTDDVLAITLPVRTYQVAV